MCGLKLLRRVGVIRLALRNLLRGIFFVFWELSNRFVNAKSLVGVRREEGLIVHRLMNFFLFFCLWRNGDVFTIHFNVRVEEVFELGLGALRESLVLHFALVVLQLLECDLLGHVVLIWLIFLNAVEGCVSVELSSLARVSEEVLGSDDDVSFFRSEVLFDLNSVGLMFVKGLDLLLHNLGGHEHLIVYGRDLFNISHTTKVAHRVLVRRT